MYCPRKKNNKRQDQLKAKDIQLYSECLLCMYEGLGKISAKKDDAKEGLGVESSAGTNNNTETQSIYRVDYGHKFKSDVLHMTTENLEALPAVTTDDKAKFLTSHEPEKCSITHVHHPSPASTSTKNMCEHHKQAV